MKRRQIVETIAAIVFIALAVLTLFVPDWIERIGRLSPDAGGGETEWLIVVGLGAIASILIFDVVNSMRRMARSADRVSHAGADGT